MHVTYGSPLVWLALCSFLHGYNKTGAACSKVIIHTCMYAYMHGAVTSCWCWAELLSIRQYKLYIHVNKRSLTASTQIAKHLASLMMSSSLVEAGGCVARVEGLHMWPPHASASLAAQQAMQDTSRRRVHWVTIIPELTQVYDCNTHAYYYTRTDGSQKIPYCWIQAQPSDLVSKTSHW